MYPGLDLMELARGPFGESCLTVFSPRIPYCPGTGRGSGPVTGSVASRLANLPGCAQQTPFLELSLLTQEQEKAGGPSTGRTKK